MKEFGGFNDFMINTIFFWAIKTMDIGIRAIKDVVMALVIDVMVICLFRAYIMDH